MFSTVILAGVNAIIKEEEENHYGLFFPLHLN